MEGEHTPEMDLTRHRQVLEKGDKFESSFLRLDRLCFFSPESGHTRLVRALWNDLRLHSVGFAFQEENASCFKARIQSTKSRRMGKITEN